MNGRLKSFLGNIWEAAADAMFPDGIKCVCCDAELSRDMPYDMCGKCFKAAPFTDENICLKCGVAMDNMSDFCQTCKFIKRDFDLARAPLIYTGKAAKLLKDFKSGDKYLAPVLSDILFDYYEKNLLPYGIGAVTYVPGDMRRVKERGYNQAEVLARGFAEKAELTFLQNCLTETRHIKKQALLTAKERKDNVLGAYEINPGFDKSVLKCADILLIDDIFTTGSTVNECAKILKKAGAGKVFVLTVATGRGK